MRTREDLIKRVLKDVGVLAAGQSPSDEDRAEIDDLIEPVCAKLYADGIAKVTGDEIDDAIYLPLAACVAEAAMLPFGIGGTRAQELAAGAAQARMDLRLAYRVYDARPPLRTEAFWGRSARVGRRQGVAPIAPAPADPAPVSVVVVAREF